MSLPKILMYVRPDCEDTDLARTVLQQHGLTWDEIDIEQDPDAMVRVKEWNQGRALTPTLWIGETMLVEPSAREIEDILSQEIK
ncbi:MAG: glutaredoxin family protein [Armatimonadota bacterium]|nr:glutaredoxin family protein [Armatimonadota bacterium]